jgi:hypothetical protein
LSNITFRQKNKKNINQLLDDLKIEKEKLSFSFDSWKSLAQEYIKKKYPEKEQEYMQILDEL